MTQRASPEAHPFARTTMQHLKTPLVSAALLLAAWACAPASASSTTASSASDSASSTASSTSDSLKKSSDGSSKTTTAVNSGDYEVVDVARVAESTTVKRKREPSGAHRSQKALPGTAVKTRALWASLWVIRMFWPEA